MISGIMRHMIRCKKSILISVLALLILSYTSSAPDSIAQAQQAAQVTLSIQAGYQGFFKENTWFPIRVALENNGPGFTGEVVAQFNVAGVDSTVYTVPVELPSVARKEVVIYIYPDQNYATELQVSLVSGQSIIGEQTISLNRLSVNDRLIGVIAENPSAYNILSLLDPPNGVASVVELQPADIPELVQGLAAINLLVLSGEDTGNLTERQKEALAGWTAWGGTLIITGGADWQETAAGLPQTGLLPFQPQASISLNVTDSQATLEQILAFSGGDETLRSSTNLLITTGLVNPGTQVLAASPSVDLPLVIDHPFGSGRVIYLTFDPSVAPFRNWNGLEDFYRVLLSASSTFPSWKNGYVDWTMAQQAVQALPSLELPSILLICGFLAIYTLAVGPANYLLLRFLKRRELGWLTIPALVISFSVLVFISGSLSRGQKPILHRLGIIQAWQGASIARLDSISGVYSPNRETFTVNGTPPGVVYPIPTYIALPGNQHTVTEDGSLFSIPEVRVDVGGIHPLGYQASLIAPVFEDNLSLSIDGLGTLLTGELKNLSDLTLEDTVLVTGNSVTNMGTFVPGQTMQVNQRLGGTPTGSATTSAGGVNTIPGISIPLPYQPYNLIEQILGTFDYYKDRQIYRKYSLMVAAMGYQPSNTQQAKEVFLMGWSRQPVAGITLQGVEAKTEDLYLYILAFSPPVEFIGERWTLNPGYFQWESIDPLRTDVSPYNLYLYSATTYGLVFSPQVDVDYSIVESLVFHLTTPYETGVVNSAEFYLWNYELQDWELLDNLIWGDNPVQEPDRYVADQDGSDELGAFIKGTIRLRVESSSSYLEITSSDFTLTVNR